MIKTHDYTARGFGHDYTYEPHNNGLEAEMSGWGQGISAGDFLLLQNKDKSTRYQVVTIRYCPDPNDMWFAKVKFSPRRKS